VRRLGSRASLLLLAAVVLCGSALGIIVATQAAPPRGPGPPPAPSVSARLSRTAAASRVVHFAISVSNPAPVPQADLTVDTGVEAGNLYYVRNVTGTTALDSQGGTLLVHHVRLPPAGKAEIGFDANVKQGVTDVIRLASRVLSSRGNVLAVAAPDVLPAPTARRGGEDRSAVRSTRRSRP
jgi:hypothetical protein